MKSQGGRVNSNYHLLDVAIRINLSIVQQSSDPIWQLDIAELYYSIAIHTPKHVEIKESPPTVIDSKITTSTVKDQ